MAGEIRGIRYYKAPSETGGTHVGRIWNAHGQQLKSVSFANETVAGWQEQSLGSPLTIQPNVEYSVSVNTVNTYYTITPAGLRSTVVNGTLSSIAGDNGRYGFTQGQYPAHSYNEANYFRDIVFCPPLSVLTTQTPDLINQSDGPNYRFELGMRFRSSRAGKITGVRFYKSSSETGTHTGRIWNAQGQQLAFAVFADETESGWQEQLLSTPLHVAADTEYMVSVNTGGIYYSITPAGLASVVSNGSLFSIVGDNGRSGFSPGQYPVDSHNNANYFRDVMFIAD